MQVSVIAVAFAAVLASVCAGPTPSSEKYIMQYSHKLSVNFKPLKENALLSFVLGMPSGKNHKDTIIYNVVGHKDGNIGVVIMATGKLGVWYKFDSLRNSTKAGLDFTGGDDDSSESEDSESGEEGMELFKDTFDDFVDMLLEMQNISAFVFHKDPMHGGAKNVLDKYGWVHPFVKSTDVELVGFLDGGMPTNNIKWDPLNREYTFEVYSKKSHMHFELVGGNKTQSNFLELDLEDEDKDEKYGMWIAVRNPDEGTVKITGPTPL